MYFFRILDSLKEDYPRLLKAIGKTRFHNLMTSYLFDTPPAHWSLRYVGERLPAFLQKNPLRGYPYAAELARFEWALLTAFDQRDVPLLTRQALLRVKPERWGALRLKTVPSFQRLRFCWPVDRIRERNLKRCPVTLLIWRRGRKVYYQRSDPLESRLLQKISQQIRLNKLCEIVARSEGVKRAAGLMNRLLTRWIRQELLEHPGP